MDFTESLPLWEKGRIVPKLNLRGGSKGEGDIQM